MRRYWLSWSEWGDDPRPIDPRLLRGVAAWWCTGYGQHDDREYTVLCAVVDAQDDLDAKAAITIPGGWHVREWRFCEPKPAGWMPPSERFPTKGATAATRESIDVVTESKGQAK